jgi:hypothetical protein
MPVDAPPLATSLPRLDRAPAPPAHQARTQRRISFICFGFALIWVLFYAVWANFPYLSSGSEVAFRAKIQAERSGEIFRNPQPGQKKLLIFGSSKILAGFVSQQFDDAAAQNGFSIRCFNSGYPARDSFVPQLKMMTDSGTIPDVLLLTEAWSKAPGPSLFQPIEDEHVVAETIFPFRYLIRDSLSFLSNARQHGGIANYYPLAQRNVEQMMKDGGYYFIAEQSHYEHDRLPDNFSEPTDNASHVASRVANAQWAQGVELRRMIAHYRMVCFYVPAYARQGAVAAAPRNNAAFQAAAEAVGCQVMGADYFSYPNALFSDEIHLNKEGARVFTADLFTTMQAALKTSVSRSRETLRALQ